ncbi:MAG: VanW family protein [Chloroflexia bacterium]|nr:VanW family protein [Chloroflexia bacterium]
MRQYLDIPTITAHTQPATSYLSSPAPTYDIRVPRPNTTAIASRLLNLINRGLIVCAIAILSLVLALLLTRGHYDGRVYPAIHVADINVGAMTPREAAARIQERASALEQGTVTFRYATQTWTPSLSDLGVVIDVDKSVDAAYLVGRGGTAWDRISSTTGLLQRDLAIPLKISLDYERLSAWFDRVDQELGLPPRDARVVATGATVSIEPEVEGVAVNRAVAYEKLLQALGGLQPVNTELPIVATTPLVTAADLVVAEESVKRGLSLPISVTFEGRNWAIQPEELGPFVSQAVDSRRSGSEAIRVTLDQDRLSQWLVDTLGSEIEREPVNAQVGWNEGLVALTASVDGITLKPAEMAAQVTASFFGTHQAVAAPVIITKPDVDSDNLWALAITTRLGGGASNYVDSSWERATNVEVGTQFLNGTLIPPQSLFSFNHSVGVIEEARGFVEAKVIDGERIDRDVGGGICQVSTTVFRAALLAGLPIVEWWPHRYELEFYERDGWTPGLDASILQPEGDPFSGGDFRFENPTDSWMLMEAWTDGARVYVIIYGPELNYTVELSEPIIGKTIPVDPPLEVIDDRLDPGTIEHTELPQEGRDIRYLREVYDATGTLIRSDDWYTLFWSRGDVYRVSPDMIGQSPASFP